MGKLIIFDMDGTLIDSDRTIVRCMLDAASHFGFTLNTVRENIGVLKLDDILRINGVPESMIRDILHYYVECYKNSFHVDTRPMEGSLETLLKLQEKNTLGVLTLKYESLTKKLLEHFFNGVRFSYIIGGDSGITDKIQGLNLIKQSSGMDASRIYYVGDRGSDMLAAMKTEINGIWAAFGLGTKDRFPDGFNYQKISSFPDLIELFSTD